MLRTPKWYSLHLYLGPTIPLGLAGRRPASDYYGEGGDRGDDYGDDGDDFQTCALIPAKPYQSFHLALLLTCEGVSGQEKGEKNVAVKKCKVQFF